MPLEWCFQPGVKLDFRHLPDGHVVSAAEVQAELARIRHALSPLEIVIINTRAGCRYGSDDYVRWAGHIGYGIRPLFFKAGQSEAQLAAAEKAIAVDPTRASLYYFKAQALVSKATIDSQTQKMTLPPGCAEAYQKYLQLEPNGQFSADAKGILSAAGVSPGKKS